MVALLPPSRFAVPAGTREHSLALFSELWEAGCHHGSQELEVSPGMGEGRWVSVPFPLSTRSCQATGAPTAQGVSGGPAGRRAGAGQGGHSERECRIAKEGKEVVSGTEVVWAPPTWPLSLRLRVPQGFPTASACTRAGCVLHSLGGLQVELCNGPGPPSHLLHQSHFDFSFLNSGHLSS